MARDQRIYAPPFARWLPIDPVILWAASDYVAISHSWWPSILVAPGHKRRIRDELGRYGYWDRIPGPATHSGPWAVPPRGQLLCPRLRRQRTAPKRGSSRPDRDLIDLHPRRRLKHKHDRTRTMAREANPATTTTPRRATPPNQRMPVKWTRAQPGAEFADGRPPSHAACTRSARPQSCAGCR